jgi:hypothetical protein
MFYYVTVKNKAVPLRYAGAKGEMNYSFFSFLTSALDGGGWSVSRPGRVLPQGNDPSTHGIGGWVGPKSGYDTEARGRILYLCRGLKPSRPHSNQMLY